MSKNRILVVDDDQSLRRVFEVQLEQEGYTAASAASARQALSMLQLQSFDLVITDLKMAELSGIELLKQIRSLYPETIIIILTAFGSVETAVAAMKAGAYDYLTKPVHPEEMSIVIRRALEHCRLVREVRVLRATLNEKYGFENILGHSEALLQVLDTAARAACTQSTVLIRGETGTGKELLAKAIAFNSSRKDKPLITINCAAIPKELLESELFGHKKGSFTGAVSDRKGKIEMADGGTLFLDEIGEMPLELQVKVLRLIQEGEIEKVGSEARHSVDVRIIAATHRDLQAMIEDGTFREDLYYRLAVIPLTLPPLRERPEDIPELVQHFFNRSKEKNGRPDLVMSASLIPYFTQHRWTGNVRELENAVERIVVLARGNEVTPQDLPEFLRRERGDMMSLEIGLPPQGISLEAIERELILKALEKCGWNQTHTARYLDISRKTLIYRMERHQIRKPPAFSDSDV
ncbi:MAG: sigma-54-dependent Fis family transcriptional regulator [Acidobacteriota bacterium]|nr:sigma-54-dependent Fis family transcriptional regulator [Acidobacteriota bacterium]